MEDFPKYPSVRSFEGPPWHSMISAGLGEYSIICTCHAMHLFVALWTMVFILWPCWLLWAESKDFTVSCLAKLHSKYYRHGTLVILWEKEYEILSSLDSSILRFRFPSILRLYLVPFGHTTTAPCCGGFPFRRTGLRALSIKTEIEVCGFPCESCNFAGNTKRGVELYRDWSLR